MTLPIGPSTEYAIVVPSDEELGLRERPRGFYFASSGTLEVTDWKDNRVKIENVAAGTFLPVSAKMIHACPDNTVALQ